MTVISVSMNKKILSEIDRVRDELGYSGRSEVLRAGARMLIEDGREKAKLSGRINSVLLLMHGPRAEDAISEIKHRFEDITKTQLHSHLGGEKCLELFILQGDSRRIKEMLRAFQASRKVDYLKLIVA